MVSFCSEFRGGRRKTRECASCLCCVLVYGFSNTREIARSLGFKVAYYSFDDNSHHGGKTGLGLEMNCAFPSFKVSPLGNHLWRCARKCYVLNAVFAFVFLPSPLNLIKCNKQRLSVLLSRLLKFLVLVLNCKCPNQCVFCCFYGFICDCLEFPSVISS